MDAETSGRWFQIVFDVAIEADDPDAARQAFDDLLDAMNGVLGEGRAWSIICDAGPVEVTES